MELRIGSLMKLSPKKTEILTLIARGYSDKEIAWILHMSIRTVNTHVSSIMLALNARTRAHAVALYMHSNPKWKVL